MDKIAIIGYGWVGNAMHKLLPQAYIYDPKIPGTLRQKANEAEIAFVCVPTPNPHNYTLDTSIVEEVISWCKADLIVVRSTVNPGDCDRWEKQYNKKIVMQPEYLGETPNHPLLDTKAHLFLIIGGNPFNRRKLIELYTTIYNANVTIRQVSNLEAEIIKLTENRAIAFKVSQCQELYDVCQAAGVDYYTIRDAVYGDDPRFNLWWTMIYPDKRGMDSKCLPKDVYAWRAWAESLGYDAEITKAILIRNTQWI